MWRVQKINRVIFLFFIFLSCRKDVDFYVCPNEIKSTLEAFKSEGEKRGINIKWNGLMVKFVNGLPDSHSGEYHKKDHVILIDTSSANYKKHELRESIIFHELGHAILNRPHLNEDLQCQYTPAKKSIMNQFPVDWSLYPYRRNYYIDEIFNSSAPAPNWCK
jgi:hypothetical protein